jgi:hypothetical protein
MKAIKLLSIIISSMVIAACGGGGGNSNNNNTSFSATTTGVAAKGIIKNATVTAYELSGTGAILRTVGTADTKTDGTYSLPIGASYAGGPLMLVLTAKSGGNSKMVCDVSTGCGTGVAFGQDYTLPPNFTLTSYQQSASNGATVTTQITPYTNMAAKRIDAQLASITPSLLDNTLVSNANSEVSQLVGVNITTTQPVDITNATALAAASADAKQYAAFNAGIGNVAFANAGDFVAGVNAAATSFADGQFTSTDPVTISSIVTAVNTEVANTPAVNTTALSATLASITANTDSVTGTYDPAPTSAATLSAVAQAKALVSQTRTWGTQIKALKTPADAFNVDINNAGTLIHSNSIGFVSVFGKVLKGAIDTVKIEANSVSGLIAKSYSYPLLFGTPTGLVSGTGTVTVSNSGGSLKLAFSSTIAGVTNSGTITTSIPGSILNAPLTNIDLAGLSLVISGNASMSSPAVSFTLTNAALNVALKQGLTTVNTATVIATDIASLGLDGDATLQANGISFNGKIKFSMVANNLANPVAPLSLAEISLSGKFTGSKGSANASVSMKVNNAATFDTIGLLSHQAMAWAYQNLPGDPLGAAAAYATATSGGILQGASYDSYSNQTCTWGSATAYSCALGDTGGVVAFIQAANPTATSVQNVYAWYDPIYGFTYNAMFTYPDFESANNFANATFTISSQVALAGSPAATLTVTANRTAYGNSTSPFVGDVVAILDFNGQSVKFETSNTTATPTIGTGALTVSNPNGVKLVLNGATNVTTGDVLVNTTKVGTVDSSGGIPMIHYTDGSFEALQ